MDKATQGDVAREFRVSRQRIGQLIRASMKNPQYLKELMSLKQAKQEVVERAESFIIKQFEDDTFIDSVDMMKKKLDQEAGLSLGMAKVRQIMTKNLGMRYRKIKALSM